VALPDRPDPLEILVAQGLLVAQDLLETLVAPDRPDPLEILVVPPVLPVLQGQTEAPVALDLPDLLETLAAPDRQGQSDPMVLQDQKETLLLTMSRAFTPSASWRACTPRFAGACQPMDPSQQSSLPHVKTGVSAVIVACATNGIC